MKDITNRKQIDELVLKFYNKALMDKVIGYIFTDVAKINLETHLPVIADFWEMVLFKSINFQEKYGRSPMATHFQLNQKENLKKEHFARWIKLFCETIDENFQGETANLAKVRALSIANSMLRNFSGEMRGVYQSVR